MKKLILVLAIVALIVPQAMAKNVIIGFVASNQGAGTQARVSNKLQEIAKREGWKIFISNAAGSWEKMNNLVEDYVNRKVDVIITAMGKSSSLKSSFQAANNAGIPIIGIDSEYSNMLTADILTNNWEMGAKVATYVVDRLNHKGNIVVFKFDQFYGTRYRGKALDMVLSEEPNINVLEVHHLPPAGFVEDARRTMEAYLLKYGDKIDAVWCAWDDPAYGASLAIRAQGFKQKNMFVVGIDGNERNLKMIQSKTTPVAATILQPFEASTEKAAELVKKLIVQKKSAEDVIGAVKVIYMSTPLVTSANASNYLK